MTSEGRPAAADSAALAHRVGEAPEYVERARGHLFEFHHLIGHADTLLAEALPALERAQQPELVAAARDLQRAGVLSGRWTYELVEDFDDGYYTAWQELDAAARARLTDGHRHGREARLKAERHADGGPADR